MVDMVRGVLTDDQEGEGERLDTTVQARDRWVSELTVWWHGGRRHAMPPCATEGESGVQRVNEVQGVVQGFREVRGGSEWTKSMVWRRYGHKCVPCTQGV